MAEEPPVVKREALGTQSRPWSKADFTIQGIRKNELHIPGTSDQGTEEKCPFAGEVGSACVSSLRLERLSIPGDLSTLGPPPVQGLTEAAPGTSQHLTLCPKVLPNSDGQMRPEGLGSRGGWEWGQGKSCAP